MTQIFYTTTLSHCVVASEKFENKSEILALRIVRGIDKARFSIYKYIRFRFTVIYNEKELSSERKNHYTPKKKKRRM